MSRKSKEPRPVGGVLYSRKAKGSLVLRRMKTNFAQVVLLRRGGRPLGVKLTMRFS